jgi:hypothetical protein
MWMGTKEKEKFVTFFVSNFVFKNHNKIIQAHYLAKRPMSFLALKQASY